MTTPGTPDPNDNLSPQDEKLAAIVAATIKQLGFKPGPSGEVVVTVAHTDPAPGTPEESDLIAETLDRAHVVYDVLTKAAEGDDQHPGNLTLARELKDALEALARQYTLTVPTAQRTRPAPATKTQSKAPAPEKGSTPGGSKGSKLKAMRNVVFGTPPDESKK